MIRSEDLISHMRPVQIVERDLRDLGMVWQMIEASAAISCPEEVAPILPTLMATRGNFDALRERLVQLMVGETAAVLGDELGAKAQCAIDILVRNLYERTADVGFLATDDSVRAHCAAPAAADDPAARAAMVARLVEYQAKYTVYDDVILLSPEGRVLARLDGQSPLTHSGDPIVAEAVQAQACIERFRRSDLAADALPALLYAHRITDGRGRTIGVLVLRFRFADEMQRIFDSINHDNSQLALVLLDADQRVIASSDEAHVPRGARMARCEDATMALTAHAGREYLSVRCRSAGYQGYSGPAWQAQAMVALNTAFRQAGAAAAPDNLGPLDNAELSGLIQDTDTINRELRRVVWNGRLMASGQAGDRTRLKAVLQQVNGAGIRTRLRVGQAIQGIYGMSLARAHRQTQELARLAADILDRNLYERANDCRWWALSPVLRAGLAAGDAGSGGEHAAMGRVLDHINGLYTVYSRLVLFDGQGSVRAASRLGAEGGPALDLPTEHPLLGSTVPDAWVQACAGLADKQRYAVTPYADTPLHDAGPTWTFMAAVREPGMGTRPIGGVAIVFNAAAELGAILRDVLAGRPGVAAFVDSHGQVLAATDPALAAALAARLAGDDGVVDKGGVRYACARVRGQGYREFQTSDGHDLGVHAVVGLRIGISERRRLHLADMDVSALRRNFGSGFGRSALEAATFQVGSGRYALPIAQVLEAIATEGLVRTPGGAPGVIGMVQATSAEGSALIPVLCARQLFGVTHPSRVGDGVLLVLATPGADRQPGLALRVDDVMNVLDIHDEQIHAAPEGIRQFAPWVRGIVECQVQTAQGQEAALVQLVDAPALVDGALPGAGWGPDTPAKPTPAGLAATDIERATQPRAVSLQH